MPRLKLIIGGIGGRPILIVDEETGRLLFFAVVYTRRLRQGEYSNPRDIVEVLRLIATKGHKTKGEYDPDMLYKVIESILLSNIPLGEKYNQIIKFIRSVVKAEKW